jgi:hypothetical protein
VRIVFATASSILHSDRPQAAGLRLISRRSRGHRDKDRGADCRQGAEGNPTDRFYMFARLHFLDRFQLSEGELLGLDLAPLDSLETEALVRDLAQAAPDFLFVQISRMRSLTVGFGSDPD